MSLDKEVEEINDEKSKEKDENSNNQTGMKEMNQATVVGGINQEEVNQEQQG